MSIPAARRAEALRLVRRGHSVNDAAKRTGISRKTITRWIAAEPAEAPPSEHTQPDAPAAAAPAQSLDAFTATANEISRTVAASSLRVAELAERDGNSTAATRALKTTRDAANDLARAERASRENEDGFFVTTAEYERAQKDIFDRVAALAADLDRTGGIVCGQCGRDLRVFLASNGAEGRAPVAPQGIAK